MFKAERHEKIKSLVNDRKHVDVSSLSKLLNVTEVTIRSDLEQLERAGFLKRLHGGAVLNEDAMEKRETDELLSGQIISYDACKEEAARAAAALIEENDRVFLGPGETCYYLAKELLQRKRLTVLTNNLYVANILSANSNIHLTLTGGQVAQGRFCVSDGIFGRTVENLYLSKCFFSLAGADIKAGYTLEDAQEISVFREIAARSGRAILLLDHRKFGNISFVRLGDMTLCDTVATDRAIPAEYVDYYRRNNITLLTRGANEEEGDA